MFEFQDQSRNNSGLIKNFKFYNWTPTCNIDDIPRNEFSRFDPLYPSMISTNNLRDLRFVFLECFNRTFCISFLDSNYIFWCGRKFCKTMIEHGIHYKNNMNLTLTFTDISPSFCSFWLHSTQSFLYIYIYIYIVLSPICHSYSVQLVSLFYCHVIRFICCSL